MDKREKVIKGLECCLPMMSERKVADCRNCPYDVEITLNGILDCHKTLLMDALDLLKAQEPRVLTLEEVRALQDDTVVWLEDNDKTDVIPAIVNHVWNSLPNIVSFSLKNMREVKADMLWYRFKWRCWTSRPTDAQRGEEPWN